MMAGATAPPTCSRTPRAPFALCPLFAQTFTGNSRRQPVGTGSAQIRRSIDPNRRRVRWLSARDRRRDYANELGNPDHLVAVSASLNRQKGARTPTSWRPRDRAAWCWYVVAWSGVKERWSLAVAPDERVALTEMLAGCH